MRNDEFYQKNSVLKNVCSSFVEKIKSKTKNEKKKIKEKNYILNQKIYKNPFYQFGNDDNTKNCIMIHLLIYMYAGIFKLLKNEFCEQRESVPQSATCASSKQF